ncbi:MAG TPA: hypothetical protein VJB14_15380 [Planctomycetota bacterium]|nr:hypothetical protein [Planctomycetota bacterium]
MAYTLMAESPRPVDWAALHGAVMPLRKRVEVFPVPASNGLGMSVPQRLRDELAWEEFTQILEVLHKRFEMEVHDLQTGAKVDPRALDALKRDFVVE